MGRPRKPSPKSAFEQDWSLLNESGRVDADAVRAARDAARAPATPEAAPDALDEASDEDDAPTRVRLRVGRDVQKRLDKYLTDRIPFLSRTRLQKLIEHDAVTVNGRAAKASTNLRAGDEIEAMLPPPPPSEIQPEEIALDALHEDDDLIVLNKQDGIIVHPARSHLSGTMVNALAWHFRHRSGLGGALSTVGGEFARPGVVHRLDRHTTGVIVFAKRDEAHWKLGHQFERREVDKRYLALVHGEIETLADVIDLPIGNHPSREKGYREKYVVRHDEQGRQAVTILRAREVFRGYTLVELELKTGRTHQIRVHLSHLGRPIVGDDMYGGKPLLAGAVAPPHVFGTDEARSLGLSAPDEVIIGRQALHAATIGFVHPASGLPMRFSAPLPADLARAIGLLRRWRRAAGPVRISGASEHVDPLLAE